MNEKLFTLIELVEYTGYSLQWLGKRCRDGKIPAVKHDGKWLISPATADTLKAKLDDLVQRKQEQRRNRYKYPYARPSVVAYKLMKKAITNDTSLTLDEREHFLTRLEAYKAAWDQAHEARKVLRAQSE